MATAATDTPSAPPAAPGGDPAPARQERRARLGREHLPAILALAALALVVVVSGFAADFPWNLGLRARLDAAADWVVSNRGSNPVFVYFLQPLSDALEASLNAVLSFFDWLTWVGVIVITFLLAVRLAGWKVAVASVAGLAALGLLGLWEESMETLALTAVAVAIALAIGIPVGVAAGTRPRVEAALRGVLDAMQTLPAYVYLIPATLLFSIGETPALIATIIYALPPAIRLTSLGIRSVPRGLLEACTSFGSTPRQMLRKVQLPVALPSIMLGVNQTIMAALAIAVIGSLVGASGLGEEVLSGLQTLDVGQALNAGVSIVLIAILLDRISGSWGRRAQFGRRHASPLTSGRARVLWAAAALLLVAALAAPSLFDLRDFPGDGALSLRGPANAIVDFAQANLFVVTGPFSDALTLWVLNPLRAALVSFPWWLLTAVVAALGWRLAGPKVAALAVVALAGIGALGMWNLSMDTLSQVLVAVVLSVAIAVPIGVLAARSDALDAALRPLLDAMQTLPSFVYLIPVVVLFNVGRVPGLIASIIYALPPAIRLTDLGIRQLPREITEAAISNGATPWQMLTRVQLPLAKPSIMLGVNQTVLMVLAGVVIAGLVGAGGLGLEAVRGLRDAQVGLGFEAGISIVLLGVVLDRVTQMYGRGHAGAPPTS